MDNSKVISHRCNTLLKNKGVSIRYSCEPIIYKDKRWYLYKIAYDCDYMELISYIEYCPFCGEHLLVKEDFKQDVKSEYIKISIQEAMLLLKNNKAVYCKYNRSFIKYNSDILESHGVPIFADEILHGEWYIRN